MRGGVRLLIRLLALIAYWRKAPAIARAVAPLRMRWDWRWRWRVGRVDKRPCVSAVRVLCSTLARWYYICAPASICRPNQRGKIPQDPAHAGPIRRVFAITSPGAVASSIAYFIY